MNAATWMKGLVVAMGLSLTGGAALAAPNNGPQAAAFGNHDRDDDNGKWGDRDDRDDHDGWGPKDRDDDRWDGHDARDARLFRLGRQKVQQGQALQRQAAELTYKARFESRPRQRVKLMTQAKNLKVRGERLEREGKMLIRRAR